METDRSTSCLTVNQLLTQYTDKLSEAKSRSLRSALFRFVLPGWDGPVPKGKRITAEEVEAALEFLTTVPAKHLSTAVDTQEDAMEQARVSANLRRVYRHHLSHFVNWCKDQGFLDVSKTSEQPEVYRFYKQRAPKVPQKKYRFPKAKYVLDESDTSSELASKLSEFEKFEQHILGKRRPTVERERWEIRRILGWLYRFKAVPLNELSLEHIIPFVRLRYTYREFSTYEAYAIAKVRAEEECEDKTKEVMALLNDYFCFRNCSASSMHLTLCTVVSLAKFIYQGETTRRKGYRSIPIVQELNAWANELKKQADQKGYVIPKETQMVDWEVALEVLEKLRFEADLEVLEYFKKGYYRVEKRTLKGRANSMFRFLTLGFLTLMPPDRQRTVRELELGRTFVRGSRDNGIFTPIERMEYKSEAKWWIHLTSEDFKTGKAYGEQWHEVSNVVFSDGKCFYDYIDRWLNEYRGCFELRGQILFPVRGGKNKGKQLTAAGLCSSIKHSFLRFTGVPVTPHRLRDMYVTYLNRIGATEAELEAAAIVMHHSRAMQSKIYNQQTKSEKAVPVYKLNAQILKKVLRA